MPTGYTAKVVDGTVTDFTTFALGCARAFVVEMRDSNDEVVPRSIAPDTAYLDEEIAGLASERERLASASTTESDMAAAADFKEKTAAREKYYADKAAENDRILAMAAMVDGWKPPEKHTSFAEFMHQQLDSSINDLSKRYYPEPIAEYGPEWRQRRLAEHDRELASAYESRAKALDRATEQNKWLEALYVSLERPAQ